MSDLASNVHLVLRDGGYETWTDAVVGPDVIVFEDEALMGFVCIFETATELLRTWRDTETKLLNRYAPRFRSAGEKSWNVYCAFLTADDADTEQTRLIRWVEENLERTRKLASGNTITRDDVEASLLPLLPIASKPVLNAETTSDRLSRRIGVIAPGLEEMLFSEATMPADVARKLAGDA